MLEDVGVSVKYCCIVVSSCRLAAALDVHMNCFASFICIDMTGIMLCCWAGVSGICIGNRIDKYRNGEVTLLLHYFYFTVLW